MDNAPVVLTVRNLSKRFNEQEVLRNISLSFFAEETVLLLGANGAGKSTFLRILAGLTHVPTGTILHAGTGRIGFASHHLFLYGRLTVQENLKLFAALVETAQARVEELLAEWGLSAVAAKVVNELSKGMQAKAALARAFLGEPGLLLLDEPSSNLDDRGTEMLAVSIKQHQPKALTIIATHDIHRLGCLATRVITMDSGHIVADTGPWASPDQVQDGIRQYREMNR